MLFPKIVSGQTRGWDAVWTWSWRRVQRGGARRGYKFKGQGFASSQDCHHESPSMIRGSVQDSAARLAGQLTTSLNAARMGWDGMGWDHGTNQSDWRGWRSGPNAFMFDVHVPDFASPNPSRTAGRGRLRWPAVPARIGNRFIAPCSRRRRMEAWAAQSPCDCDLNWRRWR